MGHSLEGLVHRVWAHLWGPAALAGEQLLPLQGLWAGGRRRVPGSSSALLACPFAPGRNYNQSCGMDGPGSCCTLDHIPLVR